MGFNFALLLLAIVGIVGATAVSVSGAWIAKRWTRGESIYESSYLERWVGDSERVTTRAMVLAMTSKQRARYATVRARLESRWRSRTSTLSLAGTDGRGSILSCSPPYSYRRSSPQW